MNKQFPFVPAEAEVAPRINDSDFVLPTHPGVSARFADDEWDLSAADHHEGRDEGTLVVKFDFIPHSAWKLAAKQLAYHRLNTRVSASVRPVAPYTCAREQIRLKRFFRWLSEYHPTITSPARMTQTALYAYHMWLKHQGQDEALDGVSGGNNRGVEGVSGRTVWTYMSPLKALDVYRAFLTEPLPFSPYNGELNARFCGFESDQEENSTPPIPDEILHPLISVAMRYVDHYHRDIGSMSREVIAYWASVEANGRETLWPGWETTVSTCPELGKPWRPPLSKADHHANHQFRAEMSHLISACATVILYLSGMRPGEFSRLQTGCLRKITDPRSGEAIRWKVRGLPLKKKKGQVKVPVDWVIPKAAADAIEVLETVLQPFRERHRSRALALNLDAFQPFPEGSKRGDFTMKQRSLQRGLNDFVSMFSSRYEMAIAYNLMPSQFRRTLARHIARQPFGVIAGKIQYRHVKTAIFEGYAGSSDDGFRYEVQDEELSAQIDLLEEMEQDEEDGCLLGAGASAILADYRSAKKTFVSEANIDPSANEIGLAAALKNLARRIHVGLLNFCVFNPEKALCLTKTEAAEDGAAPKINLCSPDKCGNSVIGSCHVPIWQSLLDDVKALEQTAKTTPQKASLAQQSARYQRVLAPIAARIQ